MLSRKNVLIIDFICIGIIILALTVRISKSLPPAFQNPGEINSEARVSRYIYNDSFSPQIPKTLSNIQAQIYATSSSSEIKKPREENAISAQSYLVGNVRTGEVFLSHRPALVLPVASMSKLVTAIAAIENIPKETVIEIGDMGSEIAPDTSNINTGEKFTSEELLYPLLLSSSNIAAEAMASSSGRVPFLELMSSYAWEVGMPRTFFADPSGLSPQNISTANDFFALARYLYEQRQDILGITRQRYFHISTTSSHGSHDVLSTHPFIDNPDFLGGKTGRTPQARETMLTIINVKGEPIAFIILASENRKKDTDYLIQKFTLLK